MLRWGNQSIFFFVKIRPVLSTQEISWLMEPRWHRTSENATEVLINICEILRLQQQKWWESDNGYEWKYLSPATSCFVNVLGRRRDHSWTSHALTFNDLYPVKWVSHFKSVTSGWTLWGTFLDTFCEVVLMWTPHNTDNKPTLDQVITGCHKATHHYLIQFWRRLIFAIWCH